MQDALLWTSLAAVGAMGMLLLAILKWVADIARQITLAQSASNGAEAAAGAALGKCELLGTDFHNHRVDTAARVAEINAKADNAAAAITHAEHRLAKAMDDFGGRLDKVVERLDRMLERRESEQRS
jgi:hypothetical protein